MARKVILELAAILRMKLQYIFDRGEDWRARQRSETLTLLDDGLSMSEVAKVVGIHVRTVGLTRMDWLRRGFDSLKDAARSGAPRKIRPDELEAIKAAATLEPLTATQLLAKHIEAGGQPVHVNTIKRTLKKSDFSWKRTRSSLRGKRDEVAFREKQAEIEQLKERAERGEIVLASCDEAGFSCVHPNRSAWTPIGKQHLIPAIRGKRLNVLAAMLYKGGLVSASYNRTTTAEIFFGFIGVLKNEVKKKYGDKDLYIIIDNASIHKAKIMQPVIELLKKDGVHLIYLSPYSPELNRIETLWGQMKHKWMKVVCRTHEMLKADVQEILDNFGGKYILSF